MSADEWTVCIGCAKKCIYRADRPEEYFLPMCGPCYYRKHVLEPMLNKYAPNAVIEGPMQPQGIFCVTPEGKQRHVVFPAPDTTHNIIESDYVACTYAKVRAMLDRDYRFDWRKHAEADDFGNSRSPILA